MEYSWEDFLSEEMYEEALESYVKQLTSNMTNLESSAVTEEMEEKRRKKHKITVLSRKRWKRPILMVELNYGKTYLSEMEEKE